MTTKTTTTALDLAFKALRARGFWARQAYCCCRSCAGAELGARAEQAKKAPRGCVFYTRQDAQALDSRAEDAVLYLAFGPIHTTARGVVGEDAADVGRAAVEELARFGCRVEWSGSPDECIAVFVRDAMRVREDRLHEVALRVPGKAWRRKTVKESALGAMVERADSDGAEMLVRLADAVS